MTKHTLFILLAFHFFSQCLYSQTFVKFAPVNPVGLYNSDCSWLDFDNDGDLDFIVSGENSTNELITRIYENKGNNLFQPASSPFDILPDFGELDHLLFNLNHDDRIDLILIGRIINGAEFLIGRSAMLVNSTVGFQDKNTLVNFSNNDGSALVTRGDVNNDGKEDLFISNIAYYEASEPILQSSIYLNTGSNFIAASGSDFVKLNIGHAEFVDIDNDQDLDLIVVGSTNNAPNYPEAQIYLNDGLGNFTRDLRQSLTKLQNSNFSVADYNNDNYLDLILIGYNAELKPTTVLYRNTGGVFTEVVNTGLANFTDGSVEWGDFDNDGDLDVLLTGFSDNTHPIDFALFKNIGNDKFQEVVDNSFEQVKSGHAAWGDYDKDGDLDIHVSGLNTANTPITFILRNELSKKNSTPSAPTNFSVTHNSSTLDLKWDKSLDNESSQVSLTYNLEIRKNCEDYLLSSFSDSTGWRKVVEQGNVGLNTSWNLNITDNGRYSLRVQAIDGGFLGSEFSNEQIVYRGTPNQPTDLQICYVNNGIQLEWADNSDNEEYFVIERLFNDGEFVVLDSVNYCTSSFTDYPIENGQYSYRISASNPNGLSGYSNIVTISVPSLLGVDLGNDRSICHLSEYTLSAGNNFTNYVWSTGQTTQSIRVSFSGEYWVRASSGCNVFQDTVLLKFETNPSVNLGPDQFICLDQIIHLDVEQEFATYIWQDGSFDSKFNVSTEGLYWVGVTNGCGFDSDTLRITNGFVEKDKLDIPNVFTPNGDSFNQFFEIDKTLLGSNLSIFNRWGDVVKTLPGYQNNWDGEDLLAGVYYYIIELKDQCETSSTQRGWLQIIR